jgi:hypothetical protein
LLFLVGNLMLHQCRRRAEAEAASEIGAKEGGCHNNCHSGDANTNAPQRNPKRHRATSPGFIDRNTRYVASTFFGCPLLRPLHRHPHPHRIVLLIANSRQYHYQGMNCQAVPSLPQAPSFKAPESCSILFVHIALIQIDSNSERFELGISRIDTSIARN